MKMSDFPDFYKVAEVLDVGDGVDKGRIKVKYLNDNVEPGIWLTCVNSFYSSGENGWHGVLGVGDKVRISFLDWPTCQKPIVDGKIMTTNTTIVRDGKEIIQVKDHQIIFEDEKVTIKHKDGTKVEIEDNICTFTASGKFNDIDFGGLELFEFLRNLITVGNLGLPCPLDPDQILEIEAAVLSSSIVKIGTGGL